MSPAATESSARTADAGRVEAARRSARRQRCLVSAVLIAISVLTCVALAIGAGVGDVTDRFSHVSAEYAVVTVVAALLAYAGYVLAYLRIVERAGITGMGFGTALQVVALGFGGWALGGGFTVDRRELVSEGVSPTRAAITSVALAATELVVLTFPAWICALVLLGAPRVPASETVPWAILFPVILAAGLLIARSHVPHGSPAADLASARGVSGAWRKLAAGLGLALALVRRPRDHGTAIAGLASYWALDVVSFWAALRLFDVTLSLPRLVLAYATGYVLTRRTLPFAGVIVTEVLMTAALVWVGVPMAAAVLPVLVYRLIDLVFTLAAALAAGDVRTPQPA